MTNIPSDSDLHDGDHTVHGLKQDIARGYAKVRDYAANNTVSIVWNLNEKAEADGIFMIEINGQKAYVNKEEMLKALRFA